MVILYTRTELSGYQYQVYANCNLSDLVDNNTDNTIFIQSRLNVTPKYYCYNSGFFFGTIVDRDITRKYMACLFMPKVSCKIYSRYRTNAQSNWSSPAELYNFNVNNSHSVYVIAKATGSVSEIEITGTYYNTYKVLSSITVDYYDASDRTTFVSDLTTFSDFTEYNNWIQNVAPPLYNWQSVPSISGKNGILQSLVQIKEEALNDGEPVSEATVLSFDSLGNVNIPSIIDEQMPVDPSDVTSVTATYLIPALENGTYEGIKLLVKKGSIPTSEEDADKVVNLDEPTSILRIDSKSVGNLDEDSHYYFVVKLVDEIGTEATSDPKDIWTSHSEGWNFDYTGSIQTFVAPKTGIYSLETWGAQGGDATDGENVARGGYGAYAYGEVLLTQGDTIYINIGGQNGYGGGGNYVSAYTLEQLIRCQDWDNDKIGSLVDTDYLTFSVMFSDLTSYFDDNFVFIGGKKNSRSYLGRIDGNNYYLSDGRDCGYGIPLYEKNISSITFDCKIDGYYNGYTEILIELVYCDLSNQVTSQYLMHIVKLPTSESQYDFTVEDNDWHTFTKTFDTPLLVNWITIVFAGRPGNVKNVHFICTD